jgi:LmbE family N-acetylglucosaminyl deacetylase
VDVTLCCLTRGEGGFTGAHSRHDIGAVREGELRNAARVLGIDDVRFLGYIDPVPAEHRNFAPAVKGRRLINQVRDLLEEKKPGLVITHGSCGEYWHPAHILLHDHVIKAVARWNREIPRGAALLTFAAWETDHPMRQYLNESDAADLTIDGAEFHLTRLESLLSHQTQQQVFEIFANGSVGDFIESTARENYHLVLKSGADLQSAAPTLAVRPPAPLSHASCATE